MHSSPSFSPPPALLITFFLSSSFFFCIFFQPSLGSDHKRQFDSYQCLPYSESSFNTHRESEREAATYETYQVRFSFPFLSFFLFLFLLEEGKYWHVAVRLGIRVARRKPRLLSLERLSSVNFNFSTRRENNKDGSIGGWEAQVFDTHLQLAAGAGAATYILENYLTSPLSVFLYFFFQY